MAETRVCPTCGAEISAESLSGLCPRCLLAAGLESQAASGDSRLPPTQSSPHGSPHGGFEPPRPEALAGRFPQLEVIELLGKGGMGAVYKARQTGLDRLVALKILPPEVSGEPGFAERFTREARALARLSHPHIVTVYDFGQADGLYYLVMEFVDGVSLREAMRSGVTPKQALGIVPQVCEALQFAHDEGVVHRDVKPENILLDKRGRVKIADFGLAKLLGADVAATGLTGTHHVMGTWRYMAPEQIEATRDVDHRADIYSLGVVFYELLTGDIPMGRFQPPSAKVQVDVRIDEVVLKALEGEPERRYQHASEVKSEVESIVNSPPLQAVPSLELSSGRQEPPPASDIEGLVGVSVGLVVIGTALSLVLGFKIWGAWPESLDQWWPLGLGGPVIVAGGVAMNQLRSYWLAFAASLLCLLTGFATVWFIFLLFPIVVAFLGGFALWLLMESKVRLAFTEQAQRLRASAVDRNVEAAIKPLEREPARREQHACEGKSEVESISGAPLVAAPAESDAARRVQSPAWGLIITGVISWVTIPLAFWIPMQRELDATQQTLIQFSFGVIPLVVGTMMALAGFEMKRLEGYRLAVAASVLPIAILLFKLVALPFGSLAINPADLVGVPMGLWALVTLTRREVKEQFHRGSSSFGFFLRPGWTLVDTTFVCVLAVGVLLAAAPGYLLSRGALANLEAEQIRWTTQFLWTPASFFIFFAILWLGLRAPYWLPFRGGKLGNTVCHLWTRLPRAIRNVGGLAAIALLYVTVASVIGNVRQSAVTARRAALERFRNVDEIIHGGQLAAAESAAHAYLGVVDRSTPSMFEHPVHDANVLLGLLSLYRGDVAGASEKLLAASRAPDIERVSADAEAFRLVGALASLGERRAPVEYLKAVKNRASPHPVEEYVMKIEEGANPLNPFMQSSGYQTPLLGTWVVGATVKTGDPPQNVWVFSRDGGLFVGMYQRRVTTFRREGDKIVFGDGQEAVVRDGQIEVAGKSGSLAPGVLKPIFQPDKGQGLAGRWIATLRYQGAPLTEAAWTFAADEEGACTMDVPTIRSTPEYRCAAIYDHLIWMPAGLDEGAKDATAPPQRASVATWLVSNRDRKIQPSPDYTMHYTALSVKGELPSGAAGEAPRLFHKVNLVHDAPYEDVRE